MLYVVSSIDTIEQNEELFIEHSRSWTGCWVSLDCHCHVASQDALRNRDVVVGIVELGLVVSILDEV